MKIIDSFEHNSTDVHRFLKKSEVPTEVDSGLRATYVRYTSHKKCAITKIWEEDGVTKIRWAYGNWDDRAKLDYKHIPSEAAAV